MMWSNDEIASYLGSVTNVTQIIITADVNIIFTANLARFRQAPKILLISPTTKSKAAAVKFSYRVRAPTDRKSVV